jgi:galactosamine-6-phosphate isomerase
MSEPSQFLQPFAHIARLTESSLQHPMLAKSSNRPQYGLTLGMAEILRSREILLLVSGSKKREAVERLLRAEITTEFPASLLWLHGNCTVLCDEQCAGS